jgi:hypothetical protein
MSDNPYRFTVEVECRLGTWMVKMKVDGFVLDLWRFDSQAEANEHAELIRQAMREVS